MNTKILEEIGFTPKEIEAYLVILELKTSSIFEIMSKAKVSRQSIYEILQKLLDKGLISYVIKDRKKQYYAVNPERLMDVIKEQETILKEKEANLQGLLPELLRRYNEKKEDTKFEIFVGKEGMKTAMNHCLKIGKPLYGLANEDKILDFLKYYMPQYRKKRKKLNIPLMIIYGECIRKRKKKLASTKSKYLPDRYNTPTTTIIYGIYVNMLIFSEHNPIAIHIKSKEISDSFMNYFNLMWKIAKE